MDNQGMVCPYCGGKVKIVDSKVIYGVSYGVSYGNAYVCSFFPGCDSYVGCHKGTDKPLGTLANSELRKLRNKCHLLFDSLWKSGKKDRDSAYAMLRHTLNLSKDECHIAMFDVDTCRRVISLLSRNSI